MDRIKFWKRDKDRETCLKNLKSWNERIGRVTKYAVRKNERKQVTSAPAQKIPSVQLRTLSQKLFTALNSYWKCNCTRRHEARFCLAGCGNSKKDPRESGVSFDFLLTGSNDPQSVSHWHEGTVMIKSSQ
jgi:hypothetical protein